jgi:hypothetical protein
MLIICVHLRTRQETPKASSSQRDEKNPFDSLSPPSLGDHGARTLTHSRGSSGGSLLHMNIGDQTPGLKTPGGVTSHASVPTTSISTTGELLRFSRGGTVSLQRASTDQMHPVP